MKNIKKFVLISLVVIVVLITFCNQYNSLIQDIENTAKSKEAQINRYIDLSKGFVDLMAIYGNDYFEHGTSNEADFYNMLNYNSKTNMFDLDVIGGTKNQSISGNLTGIGNIPSSGVYRDEINLALHFNRQFNSIFYKLPDVAWIYYTSDNNFINIYPWVSSKDFSFKPELKTTEFFTKVTPQNNPLRETLWTPVYLDQAGKGLMVTISSPIYNKDTFMGVVSLDITNNQLSEMIKSGYETHIIDDTDTVVASNLDIKFDKEIFKLDKLLNSSQISIDEIKGIANNAIKIHNGYYIYSVSFNNAPWRMFFRVPVWMVVGKTFLFTLPIIAICLLLLYTFFEVEKRRKTEALLKVSLDELTSYQKLLENAAKYDFLTSTVNRRGLKDIFDRCIENNCDNNINVSFIMGDIDHFKEFNDTYGHAAGDKVLTEIANIMQKNIKSNEVVCRWGGEEFVIMLIDRSYDEVLKLANHMRLKIESTVIPWENSMNLNATMTFGVAEHKKGDTLEKSVSNADSALYYGKEHGRNQVVDYKNLK